MRSVKKMQSLPILVVMPLYNARPFVAQAVNSILSQTYPHFCLLIIDDGSTDGGDEIVAGIRDPRLLLWHQSNHGPGFAMNRAITFAKENGFPLIARMDSDDISLPERLDIQVRLLSSANSHTAACSSNCYYIDEKTEQVIGTSTVPITPALIKWEIVHGLRGLIQPSLLARTEALSAVGGYREQFVLAEESDLFMRLAEQFTFINAPDYLCKIRLRPSSLSLKNMEENSWYSLYAIECFARRRRGQAEQSYKEFRASAGLVTRYQFWRERWLLKNWRKSLTHPNIFSLILAGLIDPRRVASRILRSLDALFTKYGQHLMDRDGKSL